MLGKLHRPHPQASGPFRMTHTSSLARPASLHAAYGAGALRPAQVVAAVHARTRALGDPGIFIHLVREQAALEAAAALPPFDPVRYPLWGLPVAVKDNIDVAGLPTTAACPAYAYIAKESAPAAQRLLDAGAVLVGKTNLDQFATGLVGVRTPYPLPRNAFAADRVPGGSSSGSAVAVARGLATLALGTDTAGSGRVPAALNNLVGLKPSLGAVSSRGVVPACRSLDCVSIFALTVEDAWAGYAAIAGEDAADAFSRPVALGAPEQAAPIARLGVPADPLLADAHAPAAWEASWRGLRRSAAPRGSGWRISWPSRKLLYERALVAEPRPGRRFRGINRMRCTPSRAHLARRALFGVDAFRGITRPDCARTAPVWDEVDAIAVPSSLLPDAGGAGGRAARAECAAGTWTNFVNLLTGGDRVPGRSAPMASGGITLIGPRGSDAGWRAGGAVQHAASRGWVDGREYRGMSEDRIEIAVVGAHLSGLALNHELVSRGGVTLRAVSTRPCYRFYALAGGPPRRPGLLRVAPGEGAAIAAEVWALPAEGFARFVAAIPAPLCIGTLLLEDGSTPKGFLVEPEGLAGAEDITRFGGWRAFLDHLASREAA